MNTYGSSSTGNNIPICKLRADDVEITKYVGQGAYAVVYGGKWKEQAVAIKAVPVQSDHPDAKTEPERQFAIQSFVHECLLLQQLTHRNILKVHGMVTLPGSVFKHFKGADNFKDREVFGMVQDLYLGKCLGYLLQQQMIHPAREMYSPEEALEWCIQIASGLAYLHGRPKMVMHRDLKLENILIRGTGKGDREAVLADFGLGAYVSKTGEACSAIGVSLHDRGVQRSLSGMMRATRDEGTGHAAYPHVPDISGTCMPSVNPAISDSGACADTYTQSPDQTPSRGPLTAIVEVTRAKDGRKSFFADPYIHSDDRDVFTDAPTLHAPVAQAVCEGVEMRPLRTPANTTSAVPSTTDGDDTADNNVELVLAALSPCHSVIQPQSFAGESTMNQSISFVHAISHPASSHDSMIRDADVQTTIASHKSPGVSASTDDTPNLQPTLKSEAARQTDPINRPPCIDEAPDSSLHAGPPKEESNMASVWSSVMMASTQNKNLDVHAPRGSYEPMYPPVDAAITHSHSHDSVTSSQYAPMGSLSADMKASRARASFVRSRSKFTMPGLLSSRSEDAAPVSSRAFTRNPSTRMLSRMKSSLRRSHPMTWALTGHTGSTAYMAPEVMKHANYNEKVDIFSFAIIMLELFSRERVFCKMDGPRELEIYGLAVSQGHRPPTPKFFPASLRTLIEACWHQEPMLRPPASELLASLERLKESNDLVGIFPNHGCCLS